MSDKLNAPTTSGRVAVASYVIFLIAFFYCGFRGLPLEKANLAFLGVCIVSLGLMVVFADILIKWTRTGRAMSIASAAGALIIVASMALLHFRR